MDATTLSRRRFVQVGLYGGAMLLIPVALISAYYSMQIVPVLARPEYEMAKLSFPAPRPRQIDDEHLAEHAGIERLTDRGVVIKRLLRVTHQLELIDFADHHR